jgi:hypothetical protein
MDLNLSRHVEIVFPIENSEFKHRLIHKILAICLARCGVSSWPSNRRKNAPLRPFPMRRPSSLRNPSSRNRRANGQRRGRSCPGSKSATDSFLPSSTRVTTSHFAPLSTGLRRIIRLLDFGGRGIINTGDNFKFRRRFNKARDSVTEPGPFLDEPFKSNPTAGCTGDLRGLPKTREFLSGPDRKRAASGWRR